MFVSRLSRLAEAFRTVPVSLCLLVSIVFAGPTRANAADAVSGTVVDQNGRPLPRVSVRALDRTGAETASVFTDESGHFSISIPSPVSGDWDRGLGTGDYDAPATITLPFPFLFSTSAAFLAAFLPLSVCAQSSAKMSSISRMTFSSVMMTPTSRRLSSSSFLRLWLPRNAPGA